jgi:hypothetical protein
MKRPPGGLVQQGTGQDADRSGYSNSYAEVTVGMCAIGQWATPWPDGGQEGAGTVMSKNAAAFFDRTASRFSSPSTARRFSRASLP